MYFVFVVVVVGGVFSQLSIDVSVAHLVPDKLLFGDEITNVQRHLAADPLTIMWIFASLLPATLIH